MHITRILPRLRRHDIDVSLFVLERGGKLEPALAGGGVDIAGPGPAPPGFRHKLRAGWQLYGHLRRHRPDIVHFFLPEPYLIGSVASMLAGFGTRIMSRRSLANYQIRHPVLAKFERWLHRHTRVLLANSNAVADELAHECGDRAKVGLIYNGVELPQPMGSAARTELRRELDISDKCLALVIVANLIAYKGHADLLAALAIANGRLPPDWRLLVVGRDDGAGHALGRQAAALGLGDHIVWLGERPNAENLFPAADIAVLASHEEGFSNSLIEAMRHGVPVIATAVGGNLDAVVSGETGLLVPVKAPAALAAAILDLASDGGRRSRMGAAARRRVKTLFSLDACIRRYVNLYRGAARFGAVPIQAILESGERSPAPQRSN